jgi:hypothetical protein
MLAAHGIHPDGYQHVPALWRDDLDERGATNRMRMSRRGDDAGVD